MTLKENIEAPLSVGLYGQCKPTMENEPDARRMAAAESSLAGNSFGMLITPGMHQRLTPIYTTFSSLEDWV